MGVMVAQKSFRSFRWSIH